MALAKGLELTLDCWLDKLLPCFFIIQLYPFDERKPSRR